MYRPDVEQMRLPVLCTFRLLGLVSPASGLNPLQNTGVNGRLYVDLSRLPIRLVEDKSWWKAYVPWPSSLRPVFTVGVSFR